MARRDRLRADVRAILERDPATERALEAVLTSPGLWARWTHRLTSWLWAREHRLLARVLSTLASLVTGVELHPGAEIDERVVIDHGHGVVVGETATIGNDALLYHGVTLGSRSSRSGNHGNGVEIADREGRHPTVGDGVTLGARATLLGSIEVGDGATVGAGAVVVDDVSPGETVVGVPAEPTDDGEQRESAEPAGDAGPADGAEQAEAGEDSTGGDERSEGASAETERHCSPRT